MGHKLGYAIPDADGKLAPVVSREEGGGAVRSGHEAEEFEKSRLQAIGQRFRQDAVRGFGDGYEAFAEELTTDVDVDALVEYLRAAGVEVRSSSLFCV